MKIKNINLGVEYRVDLCEFTAYLHEGNDEIFAYPRPVIVIAPGGGYGMVSEREGEPVAIEFYNRGYNTFVLKYSVMPTHYPEQIYQLASAIDYIKKYADEFGINPAKIFCMGFSAGGHLVASFAANIGMPLLNANPMVKNGSLDCSIAGLVLCYPVICFEGHMDSYRNLLGYDADTLMKEPKYEYLNLHKSVKSTNPPTFIWCTADDYSVPAYNSLFYATALALKGVKYELHVFKEGEHGLSLADERVYNDPPKINKEVKYWTTLADNFLKSIKTK